MLWGTGDHARNEPYKSPRGLAPSEYMSRTKNEEDLHGQVTDTRWATGSTGLPCCAHTHAVRHSDSHVECGKQDEAIPGGSQSPTVQQDEG